MSSPNQRAGVIARWDETDDNFAAREREFLTAIREDLSSAMQSGDQEKIEKLLEYVNAHRLGWDQVCTAARMASLEQHEQEHQQAAARGQLAIQELMTDLEDATAANDDVRVDALLEICAAHKGAWQTLWEAAEAAHTATHARRGMDPVVKSSSQQQVARSLASRGAGGGVQSLDATGFPLSPGGLSGAGISDYEDNLKMDQLQSSLVQMAADLRQAHVQPAEGPLPTSDRIAPQLQQQGYEQTGGRQQKSYSSQQAKLEALRRERNQWREESERLQGRFTDVRSQLEAKAGLASGRTGPSPRELGLSPGMPFQPQSEPSANMVSQARHFDTLMQQEVSFATQGPLGARGGPQDKGSGADLVTRLEELRQERNHWRMESMKLQNRHVELQSELHSTRSPHSPQVRSSGRRRQA